MEINKICVTRVPQKRHAGCVIQSQGRRQESSVALLVRLSPPRSTHHAGFLLIESKKEPALIFLLVVPRKFTRREMQRDIGTTAPLFHMTREPFLLTERECWTCMGGVCGHKDAASHPNALHYSYSLTECSWLAAHCWLIDMQPCATGRVITLSKFLAKLRRGMRIENFPFAHMKVQTRSQTHQLRERLKYTCEIIMWTNFFAVNSSDAKFIVE